MKWVRSILVLVVLILSTSYAEHITVDPMDLMWQKLYPNWFKMGQERKDDLQRLYELSPNKHLWFPDIYPDVYRYKNHYHHKYNRINKR